MVGIVGKWQGLYSRGTGCGQRIEWRTSIMGTIMRRGFDRPDHVWMGMTKRQVLGVAGKQFGTVDRGHLRSGIGSRVLVPQTSAWEM